MTKLRGRPKKYAEYEELLASLPKTMKKRPKYINNIGIFRGERGDTAWIKICLTHGGSFNSKDHPKGAYVEIKLGKLTSWTWEALEAKRNEFQGKADRGEPLEETPSIKFKDYAKQWLERAENRLRSYPTVKMHVDNQLTPTFGEKAITKINTSLVNNWITGRLKVAKPATTKRELDTLGAIFNDAVKNGIIEGNPCKHADNIKGIVGRQRFLSTEEMITLLSAANQIELWLKDFIVWCIHSGMRRGEILALTWEDITALPDGRVIVTIKKSKSDRPRLVACSLEMENILQRLNKTKNPDDKRVFQVSKMTLRRRWEDVRKKANLQDVTIHDLRRTHSTHLAAAGVDLRTLAGRLGHTDLDMLQKHYAVLMSTADTEAVKTIDKLFGDISNGKKPK